MEIKRTWDSWKNRSLITVTYDCAPNDNFVMGFRFIPSSSTPPTMLRPKYPLCSNVIFVWVGGVRSPILLILLGKRSQHFCPPLQKKFHLNARSLHTNSSTLETKVTAVTLHASIHVLSVSTTFKRREFYNIRKFKKTLDNLKSWVTENLKGFKAWVKDVF